jgi:predicted nucleic acid-binding protein
MVLAKLNVLHLLKELFSRVRIPRSVYDEAVTEGLRQGYEDARTLQIFLEQTGWLPEEVDETAIPLALHKSPLDRGERDAIGLAITLGKGVVLIDEMVGRKVAQEQGVFVCGSLRILIEAYRRELIGVDQLRLYFAEIAGRHDIWINPELVKRLEQEVFGNLE